MPKAVQASSSSAECDATNLISQSGLRDQDSDHLYEHSTDPHDMWLSAKGQANGWLEFTFEQPQKLGAICLWNYNDTWHTQRGIHQAKLSKLASGTTYYWRIDEIQSDDSPVQGDTWSFATGGLVLWWKLDESTGRRAADASDHGHTGTITGGAVWRPSAGRLGGALEFDGLDGKVEDSSANDYLNRLASVTISLWVKAHVTDEDRDILFTQDPAGQDNRIGLRCDKDGAYGGGHQCIKASFCTSVRDVHIESASGKHTTDWQHLALVWESRSALRLYVNGVRDPLAYGSGNLPGLTAGVEKLVLGRGAKDMRWDGLIDDLRIYSCALADDEIKALATGETTPGRSATEVTLRGP